MLFWLLVVFAWVEGMLFRWRRRRLVQTNHGVLLVCHESSLQLLREGAHPRDLYVAHEKLARHFAEYPFESP
jgi:hypothetical protein